MNRAGVSAVFFVVIPFAVFRFLLMIVNQGRAYIIPEFCKFISQCFTAFPDNLMPFSVCVSTGIFFNS